MLTKLIVSLLALLPTFSMAYTPNLVFLGVLVNGGRAYIDNNPHSKVNSFTQAVIYEKYNNSIQNDRGEDYKSAIRQMVVNCNSKEIAEVSVTFYKGASSNSEIVDFYILTIRRDINTGKVVHSYSDLDFEPVSNTLISENIYINTCL